MIDSEAHGQDILRVFVSYSRKDEDFAQELLAGLKLAGFSPYLDKHDIVAGEVWEARLGRLIEEADTVVFVITPDAVASKRCAWEVDYALSHNKRLFPVVWRRVEEAQVPEPLRRLNYIYFDRPMSFASSLTAMSNALKTDLVWIREHTRLSELALRWHAREKVEALLLRGEELIAAKSWLASQPKYAPEPTLLHHTFITAADDAEVARSKIERQRLELLSEALKRESEAQVERKTALDALSLALRRGQRALRVAGAMFAACLVVAIGWINQDFIAERWTWNFTVVPYMQREITPYVMPADAERRLKVGEAFRECAKHCPEMVVVPAGRFTMGHPDAKPPDDYEQPQHDVVIPKVFAVSRFLVTFEDWNACASVGRCPPFMLSDPNELLKPVVTVSWSEAKRYVEWLAAVTKRDYRLLSEAEWEYASRAGSAEAYPWGAAIGDGNANCRGCGSKWDGLQRSPVNAFSPNAFKLHDMNGNVWQWCADDWHSDYNGAPKDGSVWVGGEPTRHVVRGGSWNSGPEEVTSANRGWAESITRSDTIGFRIARTLRQ